MKKRKDKTTIGVIGVILLIFGVIGTLAIANLGKDYILWLLLTSLAVIAGVILISRAFTD